MGGENNIAAYTKLYFKLNVEMEKSKEKYYKLNLAIKISSFQVTCNFAFIFFCQNN